jgi:hypothetical protein
MALATSKRADRGIDLSGLRKAIDKCAVDSSPYLLCDINLTTLF